MRKLKVRCSDSALLILTRSRHWSDKMVYILVANKPISYLRGRSRILYIGTTKKGFGRPSASAADTASEVFYKLHGVKRIEVYIATCATRQKLHTWKELEAALLEAFLRRHLALPKCNKNQPYPRPGLFGAKSLEHVIDKIDSIKSD